MKPETETRRPHPLRKSVLDDYRKRFEQFGLANIQVCGFLDQEPKLMIKPDGDQFYQRIADFLPDLPSDFYVAFLGCFSLLPGLIQEVETLREEIKKHRNAVGKFGVEVCDVVLWGNLEGRE